MQTFGIALFVLYYVCRCDFLSVSTMNSREGIRSEFFLLHIFDCVDHNKLWKILKKMGKRPAYLSPEKPICKSVSSVAQSCPILCHPIDCSTPGFPVHHQLPKLAQTHIHHVSDATQPSHPLSSPSPPAFNLSQHQGLFQGVSSSHPVAKVLEFQLQYQSFQWIFRTDFL